MSGGGEEWIGGASIAVKVVAEPSLLSDRLRGQSGRVIRARRCSSPSRIVMKG